jgi:acetoin utilization protein AcuB
VDKKPTVAQFMTANPFTLEPESTLMEALEVMRLRGVRRIPVVLADMLVGLLVEGDLKRAEPSTLSQSQEDFQRVMEQTPISRIMIQNPVTVGPATPLLEAASTLHSTKYGALPVVEDGRLVGIITDNDMLRALIVLLQPRG